MDDCLVAWHSPAAISACETPSAAADAMAVSINTVHRSVLFLRQQAGDVFVGLVEGEHGIFGMVKFFIDWVFL